MAVGRIMSASAEPTTEEQMIEKAKAIKRQIEDALAHPLSLMDAARSMGLVVNFQVQPDQLGKNVAHVTVVKPLA